MSFDIAAFEVHVKRQIFLINQLVAWYGVVLISSP